MIFKPWDCAQPDEWLPRTLRLCWGDGGDSGGGFSGGGGFGDSGGGFTGGGDWGSSGSFDASGFNSGFEGPGTFGVGGSEFGFGQGGGGGDWASFGPTSYGGFNASNPTFADVAGPNPGVTTGGGDWGSAGAYSAAGMGGGLGGGLYGADTGGGGFYGGGGGGGGPFGDYGGGGGGGGAVGGGQQGGGAFGGFGPTGTSSGGRGGGFASSPYADDTGPAGRGTSEVSSPYADDTGPAGRGESEVSSPYADDTGPAGRGEQDTVGPAPEAEADFGKPASEAAPEAEAQPDAAPAASPATSRGGGTRSEDDAAPSAFGPQALDQQSLGEQGRGPQGAEPNVDYEGSPYADMGPIAEPGWFESLTQDTSRDDPSTLPSILSNWFDNLQNAPVADRAFVDPITTSPGFRSAFVNPVTDLFPVAHDPLVDPPQADRAFVNPFALTTPLWAQNPKAFAPLSILNREGFRDIFTNPVTQLFPVANDPLTNALNPGAEQYGVTPSPDLATQLGIQDMSPGGIEPGGEQYGVQASDLASQLGIENVSAPTAETDTTDWGSVFEGAAPPAQDLASQLGRGDIDTTDWGSVFEGAAPDPTDWGSVFEGAPSNQNVDWASVFEAPEQAPDYASVFEGTPSSPDWTSVFEGAPSVDPNAPTVDQTAPANQPSVDTTMESGPPGAPTTTDDATTKGGDPALSGLSVDAAGAPGGAPGAPGARGSSDPGVSPDAAVNAASNAALAVSAPAAVVDAVSQAVGAAQESGANPTDTAAAARDAALTNDATQEQADAIASATYAAAVSQASNVIGTIPGQPGTPEGEQTTSTTSAPTPAPPSLVDMAQPAPATPMPQSRPAEAPGLIDMAPAQPGVPMPQARPADAPLSPEQHGEGTPGGEGDPDQGSSPAVARPPADIPATPGGVTAADRAARGPNAQPEPQHVQDARQYLLGTANPGDTMNRQGPAVAIARLEPNFAVRLAGAIREARANGLPNASVFSAFRAPAFGANPGYAAISQHGRGIAVDMSGIGRPGSREAQLWYQIATRNGLYNPYGANNRAEWNHYQAVPETGRQTANRLGPNPRTPPDNMVPTWARVGVRPVEDIPNVRTAQQARPPAAPMPGRQGGIGSDEAVTAPTQPLMIGFKGLNGAFDEQAFNDHAAKMGYAPVTVNSVNEARAILDAATGRVGLYGFSKGANTAHALLGEKGVKDKVDRVVTVAPFHSQQTGNFKGTNWDNYPDYSSRGIDPQGQGFNIQTRAHTKEAQREAAAGQQQPQVAQPTAPPADIPAEIPAARPPPDAPLPPEPAPRPPADIPAPAPFLAPPARGRVDPMLQTRVANDILKDATKNLTAKSGEAEFQAASVVAAKALAAAGIPAAMARSLMAKGAYEGAAKNGYDINSFPMGGVYKGKIDGGIDAAMQGYQSAKPGEVQGPSGFQPDAPGKQGALPSGQQFADLSQSLGPQLQQPSLVMPGLDHLSPLTAPPAPPPTWGQPPAPPPAPLYSPNDPGMFNPFRGNEAALPGQQFARELTTPPDPNAPPLDPNAPPPAPVRGGRIMQADASPGLMDMLGNVLAQFNPISTAEAKGRGRDSTLEQAIALAREGGNFGGQRGTSVVGNKVFTFYAPGASGPKGTEGPMVGSKGNPLTTLDDVRNGAGFVSLAGHPAQFGQQVFIGDITYTSPVDGKQYTLNNVVGRVDDTGGKFGGRDNPDQNHFDIAVGDFSRGWNDRTAGSFVASNYATAVPGRGIGSDYAADDLGTAVGAQPPQEAPMRGLAKGGHVDKDEPVVVGEEGPETFVPDEPGTVFPHMPQPGKGKNIDRWPKIPAPDYPGRYGGVEREILRQTRNAQNAEPSLMDMIDSGRLRLTPNWQRMLNDPALIALGRSRMDDRREGIDPGAEQYGAFILPAPAAEPPDPTSQMAQALGYGSMRRPLRVGRQSY